MFFFFSRPLAHVYTGLLSLLLQSLTLPLLPLRPAPAPLACGSVRTFLQPIAVPAETIACDRTRTHTHTLELFSHSALSDQSHDGLPNSSTRLNTSELQAESFYLVSNDGNAREASCCQRTQCHSRFLYARFRWVDGANLTQIVAAICNHFEFCFVLLGSSLVSLPP